MLPIEDKSLGASAASNPKPEFHRKNAKEFGNMVVGRPELKRKNAMPAGGMFVGHPCSSSSSEVCSPLPKKHKALATDYLSEGDELALDSILEKDFPKAKIKRPAASMKKPANVMKKPVVCEAVPEVAQGSAKCSFKHRKTSSAYILQKTLPLKKGNQKRKLQKLAGKPARKWQQRSTQVCCNETVKMFGEKNCCVQLFLALLLATVSLWYMPRK